MPAANPLGTPGAATASGMSSSQGTSAGAQVSGTANLGVAGLVGVSLLIILALHVAGFRFAFDVSVGKK